MTVIFVALVGVAAFLANNNSALLISTVKLHGLQCTRRNTADCFVTMDFGPPTGVRKFYRPSDIQRLNNINRHDDSIDVSTHAKRGIYQTWFGRSKKCPACAEWMEGSDAHGAFPQCGKFGDVWTGGPTSDFVRIQVCPPEKPICAADRVCYTEDTMKEALRYQDNENHDNFVAGHGEGYSEMIVGSYFAWGTANAAKVHTYRECCNKPASSAANRAPTTKQPTGTRAPTPQPTFARRTKTFHTRDFPCNFNNNGKSFDNEDGKPSFIHGCQTLRWGTCKAVGTPGHKHYSNPYQGPCRGSCKQGTCCDQSSSFGGSSHTHKKAGSLCQMCAVTDTYDTTAGTCSKCLSKDSSIHANIKLVHNAETDYTSDAPYNKVPKAGTCVVSGDNDSGNNDCLHAASHKFKDTNWAGWKCHDMNVNWDWDPAYCTGMGYSFHSSLITAKHVWHANVCCADTCKGTSVQHAPTAVKAYLTSWGLGEYGKIFYGEIPECTGSCTPDYVE